MVELCLNEAQRSAINHSSGPALVLAGPGSGKTTVIINRLKLLAEKWQAPQRLLSVTFNKAAALEMKMRYEKKCLSEYEAKIYPNFLTIHSLCYKIIKSTKENSSFQLIEDLNSMASPRKIIGCIYKEINGNTLSQNELDKIISCISRSRNRNIQQNPLDFDPQIRNFEKICRTYENYKADHQCFDYDDLIFKAAEILENNEEIRYQWNLKFDYIQVDEGQDLSMVQFRIIQIICKNTNVFVVADDDQSIYGFRGAEPSCILNFEKYYPSCKKYYLERNYRSGKKIVDLSLGIITKNKIRYEKKLYSEEKENGKICFRHFTRGFYQGKYICNGIIQGRYGNEIGILYRNNISALVIVAFLSKLGYPFEVAGGNEKLLTHWIISDFLKELESAEKLLPLFVFTRNLNCLYNYISRAGFFENCAKICEKRGQDGTIVNGLAEFLFTICNISRNLSELFRVLLAVKESFNKNFSWEDVSKNNFDMDCHITLSTIHSAKGLEYKSVFLIDLIQGEFPGKSSESGVLFEEERRLFYVGITRAKKNLYFTFPEKRGIATENASVFYCEAFRIWKNLKG